MTENDNLPLSPSENAAHDTAMRVSGAARGRTSTKRALASIVLGFELIIVVLIGLTLFGLSTLDPRELGLYIGGGLAAVILVAFVLMRRGNAGIITGWILHGLMLACGFILPMAFFVGLLFTALWIYCMVKGAAIDRQREAWFRGQQGQGPVSQ